MEKTGFSFDNEKGALAILVVILLPVFLGITAFVIDFGYTRIVRNQLQNAADAAALAACNYFYDRNPPNYSNPSDLIPNWNDAVAEALDAITDNSADNNYLQNGTTAVGWWDITQAYPGSMWPDPLTSPPPDTPPTADYGPAISVAVTKTTGQNDGPVSSFFGRIFGFGSYDGISANATAVAASPGSVRPESVAPQAISKAVLDLHYNDYNDAENLIAIGSSYHYPTSLAGQWTALKTKNESASYVSGLIADGNPEALSIGDDIWIQPGTETSLYKDFQAAYPAGDDIVFPVVALNNESDALDTKGWRTTVGFVGFHIECVYKGCNGKEYTYDGETKTLKNDKVIVGYFTTAPNYGSGSLGPHYGPIDRCRLSK